jgi:hypothetical protein
MKLQWNGIFHGVIYSIPADYGHSSHSLLHYGIYPFLWYGSGYFSPAVDTALYYRLYLHRVKAVWRPQSQGKERGYFSRSNILFAQEIPPHAAFRGEYRVFLRVPLEGLGLGYILGGLSLCLY